MRIVVAVPEAHVTKPVLDGALEAVTRLNEQLIKSGASPTSRQLIAKGAEWRPEKPGAEHFDHGALIAERGHGDCDDWAPLHAATLRVTGEDPGALAVVKKSGPKRWHAIVRRSDGTIDDPSLAAGMPGPARTVGVMGATLPAMRQRLHGVGGTFIATPHLALRPVPDRFGQVESWQARADLPWHWQPGDSPADVAMVTLHQSPVSDQAVVGAVRGAFRLGLASGYADPEHLKRMSAIADACEGAEWEDLAEMYGPEHATAAGALVEGFFGKVFKKLGKGLGKIAKGALKVATPLATSLIPGAGLAKAAFDMASPAMKGLVTSRKHKPPGQREPLRISEKSPILHDAPARSAPSHAPGPVIVHQPDPNGPLLDMFASRLQRAYEFSAARPSVGHRAQMRGYRSRPRAPGTAWPPPRR